MGSRRGGGASDVCSLLSCPIPPHATRRSPARRLPVAVATVAQRLPEGASVSWLIPSPAPHCPAIFVWVQRQRHKKKWRSGARRRLRQVCGGDRPGKVLRLQGCPGPEGTGNLSVARTLRKHFWCLRGGAMTSGSGLKGGAYPSEWQAGTSLCRWRRGVWGSVHTPE